jgi:regulator of protease activity HflC (stomatin/prohibitin superfamily)
MKLVLISLSLISIFYWLVATANNKAQKARMANSKAFVIIPIILICLLSFLTIIPAQNCGVVITPAGVKQESYATGWHVILPIYTVKLMDKTAQVYTCANRTTVSRDDPQYHEYKVAATQSGTIWAPTVDGIKMGFDISASWSIDPVYAWWIYDNVSELDGAGNGRFFWLEENVIKPKLKSALALTVSRYNPIEVYSNRRQNIQDEVYEKMKIDINSYHLKLNQIDIREVYYNEEYERAINSKKLEEQKVLTLIEITKQKREQEIQAEIDKNIAIKVAEGQARALQIKGQSVVNNPKIVELEWISKWNGQLPTYMLGSGQGVMLNLGK